MCIRYRVEEIFNLYDHYSGLMERAEQDMGGLLIDMVGGQDNVAGFFDISNYNITQWISDYLDKTANTYYTQRLYIACLLYTSESKKSRLFSYDNKKWRDFLVKIRKVHDHRQP